MTFKNYILENQVSNTAGREDFDGKDLWEEYKSKAKLAKNKGLEGYELYTYKDFYFYIKDNNYYSHIERFAKEDGKVFVSIAYSNARGANLLLMLSILKMPGIKHIVSDVLLSDDAVKQWLKILKNKSLTKSFVNYKDEIVITKKSFSDVEIKKYYESADYRVVLSK